MDTGSTTLNIVLSVISILNIAIFAEFIGRSSPMTDRVHENRVLSACIILVAFSPVLIFAVMSYMGSFGLNDKPSTIPSLVAYAVIVGLVALMSFTRSKSIYALRKKYSIVEG